MLTVTWEDVGSQLMFAASCDDAKSRTDAVLVLADMLEDGGRGEGAAWIRCHVDSGVEPLQAVQYQHMVRLQSCCEFGRSPRFAVRNGVIVGASFRGCSLVNVGPLLEFPWMEYLDFSSTRLSDDASAFLDSMNLRVFHADYTQVGVGTIRRLVRMSRLESVSLLSTRISIQAAETLLELADRIKRLHYDSWILPPTIGARMEGRFRGRLRAPASVDAVTYAAAHGCSVRPS